MPNRVECLICKKDKVSPPDLEDGPYICDECYFSEEFTNGLRIKFSKKYLFMKFGLANKVPTRCKVSALEGR